MNKIELNWIYHKNTDKFYIFPVSEDYGNETEFIHVIGKYNTGSIQELRDLLENSNHFLLNVPNLEELIYNDIEQF